ncbi:photosystem II 5 kD protein [Dorcoceras hygrometricum]|uniref:Photosystem II 5 kD protein n=1 Tax=Dorcoceras hygrometricum TaxID=472368 RepID=A0A2Z7CKI3_9LAMI|nr:photosystem II 5 kD protein [Dorcoceras hygrometricum]
MSCWPRAIGRDLNRLRTSSSSVLLSAWELQVIQLDRVEHWLIFMRVFGSRAVYFECAVASMAVSRVAKPSIAWKRSVGLLEDNRVAPVLLSSCGSECFAAMGRLGSTHAPISLGHRRVELFYLCFWEHCDVLNIQMDGFPGELSNYPRSDSPSGYHLSSGESEHSRCRYSDLQDVCMAIESIMTLDLPMVVDSIEIYEMKGPYYMLTMTDSFLQELSVIPRGSWGDVSRRFTMIRWICDARTHGNHELGHNKAEQYLKTNRSLLFTSIVKTAARTFTNIGIGILNETTSSVQESIVRKITYLNETSRDFGMNILTKTMSFTQQPDVNKIRLVNANANNQLLIMNSTTTEYNDGMQLLNMNNTTIEYNDGMQLLNMNSATAEYNDRMQLLNMNSATAEYDLVLQHQNDDRAIGRCLSNQTLY